MAENFNPVIGKTVLETLTSGMYDDARFIFREYIQNAADQIDTAVEMKILEDISVGTIEIKIDDTHQKITIADNATGISQKDVLQFLGDVANSQKEAIKQKGFRGIGRLGGLGYCNKLIFETSYQGEAVCSVMTLDAKLLKKIIADRKDTSDAAAAISIITTVEKTKEDINLHYFRVTLDGVHSENVLDVNSIREYLSMVAPVPFSSAFAFADEIKTYLNSRKLNLDEYNIELNGATIFKAYKDNFSEDDGTTSKLVGVDYVDIYNNEQELLALCWYGFRDRSNYLISDTNIEKGIRIRTKNITIGDKTTCNRFFDQDRTNQRFIGEIHTLSDGFIPNARRDYFNENNTRQMFEKNATEIFTEQNLENRLAQTASKLHNKLKEVQNYQKSYSEFKVQRGNFENEAGETYQLNRLKELEEKAIKAKKEIEKINTKANKFPNIKSLYNSIIGEKNTNIHRLGSSDLQISKYDPPKFATLNDEQKKVVLEIFDILEEELDFNMSELIKKRIVEKFN